MKKKSEKIHLSDSYFPGNLIIDGALRRAESELYARPEASFLASIATHSPATRLVKPKAAIECVG